MITLYPKDGKFTALWKDGYDAHLDCHAEQAWVCLRLRLRNADNPVKEMSQRKEGCRASRIARENDFCSS